MKYCYIQHENKDGDFVNMLLYLSSTDEFAKVSTNTDDEEAVMWIRSKHGKMCILLSKISDCATNCKILHKFLMSEPAIKTRFVDE